MREEEINEDLDQRFSTFFGVRLLLTITRSRESSFSYCDQNSKLIT
jgi:hypothetical protein